MGGASCSQPRYNPSHRGVTILAPVTQPAVTGLAEHSVTDGAAIGQGQDAAASGIGSSLQSLAAKLAFLGQSGVTGGQIEQPLSTVAAHDGGFLDGALGQGNSNDGGDAGAGETVRTGHDPQGVVGASLAPVFKL